MQDSGLILIDDYFDDNLSQEEILEFTNSIQSHILNSSDIINFSLLFLVISLVIGYFFERYCRKNKYRYQAIKRWDEILTQNNHTLKALSLLELMRDVAEDSFDKNSLPITYDSSWWNFIEENSDVIIDRTLINISKKLFTQPHEEITGIEMMLIANSVNDWIQTHRPKC